MRLGSALDHNEQLDNELVGHLALHARVRPSPTTSLGSSQNAIEVKYIILVRVCLFLGSLLD